MWIMETVGNRNMEEEVQQAKGRNGRTLGWGGRRDKDLAG